MTRKILEEEPYFYSLVSEAGSHFLEVCCGSVAVYEVRIKLTANEISKAASDPDFIRVLAQQISDDPKRFVDRIVND